MAKGNYRYALISTWDDKIGSARIDEKLSVETQVERYTVYAIGTEEEIREYIRKASKDRDRYFREPTEEKFDSIVKVCRESQEIGLEYNVKERDEYENSWAVTGLKPYDRVK